MNYYVYILTNPSYTVLYTGVTKDLVKRVYEHKMHLDPDIFTAKYNAENLVYYESTTDIKAALEREKQIKKWSRKKKDFLIDTMNPERKDLYPTNHKLSKIPVIPSDRRESRDLK